MCIVVLIILPVSDYVIACRIHIPFFEMDASHDGIVGQRNFRIRIGLVNAAQTLFEGVEVLGLMVKKETCGRG